MSMSALANEVMDASTDQLVEVDGQQVADFPQFQSAEGLDVDEVMDSLDQGEHPGTEEVKKIYHQDPTPLDQRADTSNLWQFPDMDQQKLVSYRYHPITSLFVKCCQLIAKNWGIEPQDVVPAEMRPYTPYSLALLLALRRLSSNMKQRPDIGQEALLGTWRKRVEQPSGLAFDKSGVQIVQTQVQGTIVDPIACEEVIQETNFGLTLKDVITATRAGKKAAKGWAPLPSQPAGKLRGGDRGARKAQEKATKKERKAKDKASRDAEKQKRDKDLASFAQSTKIEKKIQQKQKGKLRDRLKGEKGYKLLAFLRGDDVDMDGGATYGPDGEAPDAADGADAPPNSPEPDAVDPTLNLTESFMRDESGKRRSVRLRNAGHVEPALNAVPSGKDGDDARPSGRDRHNADLLSQMFNRVDMDSEQEIKRKREKQLLTGAAKREASMPTDRIKLAEMPTLYARQGTRQVEEALEGLGKMGLENGQQTHSGMVISNGEAAPVSRKGEVVVLSDDEEL